MLKSTSRLGSDRAITDITLTATIIRIVITGRTMATTGLIIGTAGTATIATIATIVTIIITGNKCDVGSKDPERAGSRAISSQFPFLKSASFARKNGAAATFLN
jgi:hypothetical protein